MLQKKLDKLVYRPNLPLRSALREVYRNSAHICLVCDRTRKLLGIVTLGDLKYALMQGKDPETPVRAVMNTDFVSVPEGMSQARMEKVARTKNPLGTGTVENVPVLDSRGRLRALYVSNARPAARGCVLVTGGAGYMGSSVCRMLLEKGYQVVALDRLLFGDEGIRSLRRDPHFSVIEGDIGDIGTLVRAVPGVDYVVHLAGIVGDPASSLDPLQTMEENLFATKMLIELAKYYQVSRFVFASSCSVYGAGPNMLDERSRLNPVSLYAQSKLYSERDLLRAAGKEFHPVILRFGTLYGLSSRMRFDLVVNTMTAHAFFKKKITVDGGAQWRPLVHVEDAARAVVTALEAPLAKVDRQIFNVGDTSENYRIGDIARAVAKCVKGSTLSILDTVRDRRDYHVSFAKINRVMRFRAKRTLSEGIGEIVAAMKKGKFRAWQEKRYSNYLTHKSVLDTPAYVAETARSRAR